MTARIALFLVWLTERAAVAHEHSHNHFGFDCELGYQLWKQLWSKQKQEWCCSYVQRACPGDTSYAGGTPKFNCKAFLDEFDDGWSTQKKEWCCLHAGIGCRYDCHPNPRYVLTKEHAAWCCNKFPPIGCEAESRPAFDCDMGAARWERSWSVGKQEFCCEKQPPLGCKYNCTSGLDRWRESWTHAQQDWCCHNDPPHGCVYDCRKGLVKWSRAWSDEKKDWCCRHHQLGCWARE
mmetsp:Transcript_94290/g.219081  ORF Transcript_94290/g.219081 Transcript_94290/m.219081 type:complete len:235 (-) Transcript_94290:60-764(-)